MEDDESLAGTMVEALRRFGHDVEHVTTGLEALTALGKAEFVLLELGLPDLDGQEVCRRIRQQSWIPIIVVTGRGDELNRVLLLETGADDFVVKPYSMRELLARMDAVVRRGAVGEVGRALRVPAAGPVEEQRRHGPLQVDLRVRRASLHDREVTLTRREFDLLAVLLDDPGAVVGRQELIERVWDENWHGSTRTLDVHVGSLRTKLGDRRWIESVRGVGFRVRMPDNDRGVSRSSG
ncbi:response regulator transcription factor [Micromonospora andamanensis]|uniref:response regulator transcription factor n=1 Tax=Micromonospora andamanensis TaxID=1287068 RepID=UPI001EF2D2CD|nr:response regulator transcription factor [Micromonospora andamanensis]